MLAGGCAGASPERRRSGSRRRSESLAFLAQSTAVADAVVGSPRQRNASRDRTLASARSRPIRRSRSSPSMSSSLDADRHAPPHLGFAASGRKAPVVALGWPPEGPGSPPDSGRRRTGHTMSGRPSSNRTAPGAERSAPAAAMITTTAPRGQGSPAPRAGQSGEVLLMAGGWLAEGFLGLLKRDSWDASVWEAWRGGGLGSGFWVGGRWASGPAAGGQ